MASNMFPEEELTCGVCSDIYKDPVVLTCCHNVCRDCLPKFWQENDCKECPVCGKHCEKEEFPQNMCLKKICERIQQQKKVQRDSPQKTSADTEGLCSLHNVELQLFCLDCKRPICVVCRHARRHQEHNVLPIEEIMGEFKEELNVNIEDVKQKLTKFNQFKFNFQRAADFIQVQAQDTENQIRQEFEKMHQFLRNEEATRIAALKEEEEQKTQMMKEEIEDVDIVIKDILASIRRAERRYAMMVQDDVRFLKKYKGNVKKPKRNLKDPERLPGTLINVAEHLGNLKFKVWEKMKDIVQYVPVTLDPNTAHPQLSLSEELTSVTHIDEAQDLPDNVERFDKLSNVLGSEGFASGTHCWEVEIGEGNFWGLGVRTESDQRKGQFSSSSRVWSVSHADGKYSADSPSQQPTLLNVTGNPKRIRVQLDCDKGKLSIFDLDQNTRLHTFTEIVKERLCPLFYGRISLRILPRDVTIQVQLK